MRDQSGVIIGASKIIRDMTDRKRIDHVSARLAAIVTSADDAILSKTLNGVITSWNPGAERMFGYSAEEMIGQPILRLIPPERQTEEGEILRGFERESGSNTMRPCVRRRTGRLSTSLSLFRP